MKREIGMDCWPSGDRNCCRAQFNIALRYRERRDAGYERLHKEAGAAGWCIGHVGGQAYYVCPDHKDTVFDPLSLAA